MPAFPASRSASGTGSSNILSSSDESVRTAGPLSMRASRPRFWLTSRARAVWAYHAERPSDCRDGAQNWAQFFGLAPRGSAQLSAPGVSCPWHGLARSLRFGPTGAISTDLERSLRCRITAFASRSPCPFCGENGLRLRPGQLEVRLCSRRRDKGTRRMQYRRSCAWPSRRNSLQHPGLRVARSGARIEARTRTVSYLILRRPSDLGPEGDELTVHVGLAVQ